jgi:hypothetical protein
LLLVYGCVGEPGAWIYICFKPVNGRMRVVQAMMAVLERREEQDDQEKKAVG